MGAIRKRLAALLTVGAMTALTGCIGGETTVELDEELLGLVQDAAGGGSGIELKLGMSVPNTGSWGTGAQKFAELIQERTNGKYYVTIYGNDELAGGNQVSGLEMCQQGSIDISMQDCLIWSSIDARLCLPAFPWLLPTEEDADEILNGAGGDVLKEILASCSVHCIGIGSNGYRQITNTKHEVLTPEDLEGLKIRVPGISMYVSAFKALGADPVTMNASERYTALQQGAIDGCENPYELFLTQKDAEVVNYMSAWNYSYDPVFICTSGQVWDSLSDEEKEIFESCGKEAMDTLTEALRSEEENYKKQLQEEYGILLSELDDTQISAFKEKAAPVYEEFRDTIGEDLFAAFGYTFD